MCRSHIQRGSHRSHIQRSGHCVGGRAGGERRAGAGTAVWLDAVCRYGADDRINSVCVVVGVFDTMTELSGRDVGVNAKNEEAMNSASNNLHNYCTNNILSLHIHLYQSRIRLKTFVKVIVTN